jgi:SNF2 family DNA or RNA helicase
MADGTFLALGRAFRRRLLDLNALGDLHDRGLRLHAGAAALLGDLGEGLDGFQGDRAWKVLTARVRGALALEPAVPATLEAELRGYQEDGFRWMMRLAHAGLGACLADDMGLGKTLQALALLLARGGGGPALVVAPTSVCANWEHEAARFAPALRVRNLAGGDREAILAQAGPMDLVVASYGLLHLESEALAKVAWSTVVLDEAQAIKNAFTRRSRAAMALQAGFRLVLSGTPVENHLGELWNILRFLNPGLLGSLDTFQRRFQLPIERRGDAEALSRLKRLVSPFLLRRTKAQVLDELPPRTEITLEVEPSTEEIALLEAIRQRSLEELADGGQPIQVLAAIMRLRRACCHPELAQPGVGLPSSKGEAFLELLAHLRENRHRALVFSQFTGHLALIRADLDRLGVPYLYLDGATAPRARAKAVAAFQRGEGDAFLISLKAGGTGLNLTGADYVIHMDPWWNPAVEDQASDRAHRIGQTRPVTIYRLVLKGSIEQRIVDLHARKRQLADDLLEGAASPAKLDTAALMELLRA